MLSIEIWIWGNQNLFWGFEIKLRYLSLKVENTFVKGTASLKKIVGKVKFGKN